MIPLFILIFFNLDIKIKLGKFLNNCKINTKKTRYINQVYSRPGNNYEKFVILYGNVGKV